MSFSARREPVSQVKPVILSAAKDLGCLHILHRAQNDLSYNFFSVSSVPPCLRGFLSIHLKSAT
jgi:hypothetical protein